MKYLIAVMAVLMMGWGGVAKASYVRELDQPLLKAFVPSGYDNNDSIEIVVAGTFPSSCYQLGKDNISLNLEQGLIGIKMKAYEYDADCLKTPSHFYHTTQLGMIWKPGTYRIIDETSQKLIGQVRVEQADKVLPDAYDYAPLTDAFFVPSRTPYLALQGAFSNSCLGFKSVEMNVSQNAIVVLPRIGWVKRTDCTRGHFPFSKAFAVKKALPSQSFLLHVRAMTGRSINKIIMLP